jgi:hypothetical protein
MQTWAAWRRRLAGLRDAGIRWARMPPALGPPRRRFVVIQIDGLSHAAFQRALALGYLRATGQLLRRGALRASKLPVGLPTSTPAFQAGLMYGGPVDVPAFEYLDKRTGEYLWFPRPWVSARVEEAHADGRQGIMEGGRTYGCIFGGGAADTVLTFAHVLRPSTRWGRLGIRARVVPFALLAWVSAKMLVVAVLESVRWLARAARDFCLGRPVSSPRRWVVRLVISGWLRELFTLSVTADVYGGVPALYVNFVDYDVPAHALGPGSRTALRALRHVDASIRDIWNAVRRVPDLGYDLFVLSDHGQITSVPFETVGGPLSVAETVFGLFLVGSEVPGPGVADLLGRVAPPLWPLSPVWQQHVAYLEPRSRERNAVWVGNLCVVPAGPNVNVYLTDVAGHAKAEQIEERYPGALERLSRHPGIGFVLVRGSRGPLCYYRGTVLSIPPPPGPTGCPLFDREDRALVAKCLEDLLAMPSTGDVVLYGHYAPAGCVSFLGERGSHAGPSEEELYGVALAPPHVTFDFAAVSGPRDLYPLFAGYQEPAAATRESAWAR